MKFAYKQQEKKRDREEAILEKTIFFAHFSSHRPSNFSKVDHVTGCVCVRERERERGHHALLNYSVLRVA